MAKTYTLPYLLQMIGGLRREVDCSNPLIREILAAAEDLRRQHEHDLTNLTVVVKKSNRDANGGFPLSSFAPVDLMIPGQSTIRISPDATGDAVAARLAACWNFCLGVPTAELDPGNAQELFHKTP